MNGTLTNAAYYKIEGAVDPALPFSLTARARVTSGGQALAFYVATNTLFAGINLSTTTIIDETKGALLASLDNTVFHDYRIAGTFGAGYQLFVDNTLLASGSFGAYPINMLAFGDSGSFGGGQAEITELSFQQTSVPEPATLFLLLSGVGSLGTRFGGRARGAS